MIYLISLAMLFQYHTEVLDQILQYLLSLHHILQSGMENKIPLPPTNYSTNEHSRTNLHAQRNSHRLAVLPSFLCNNPNQLNIENAQISSQYLQSKNKRVNKYQLRLGKEKNSNVPSAVVVKSQHKRSNPSLISKVMERGGKSKVIQRKSFYYYVSDVEKDIRNFDQQSEGIFLSHIIFSMYIRKYHQFTYPPELPVRFQVPKSKPDRKLIIFDLDETLVHGISVIQSILASRNQYKDQFKMTLKQEPDQSLKTNSVFNTKFEEMEQQILHRQPCEYENRAEEMVSFLKPKSNREMKRREERQEFVVSIRPHAKQMLKRLSHQFTLAVFTASHRSYAEQVVKNIDPSRELFSFVVDRRYCSRISGSLGEGASDSPPIKDLRVLDKFDPSKTVLVDNSCLSYLIQPENGVPIIPFIDNAEDEQLLKLEQFLVSHILPCSDVRPIIKQWFGVSEYHKFTTAKDLIESIIKAWRVGD